jgi:hypothetical protein
MNTIEKGIFAAALVFQPLPAEGLPPVTQIAVSEQQKDTATSSLPLGLQIMKILPDDGPIDRLPEMTAEDMPPRAVRQMIAGTHGKKKVWIIEDVEEIPYTRPISVLNCFS